MKRVLIIDDSQSFRKSLIQTLDIIQLDILEAEDGKDGLRVLEEENGNIDLILLDFFMPNMDGMDFFLEVHNHDTFKTIPVVMITTAVDKDKMINAVRAGIKHYITKPFTPEDLLTKVVKILDLEL
jgi:two-component system chemotaxis response regulator CheY